MGGLDLDFIGVRLLMSNLVLLLHEHRLLLLRHQQLLLVVCAMLALSELLVLQAQTKAIAARHLRLTPMDRSQLLLTHVGRLR